MFLIWYHNNQLMINWLNPKKRKNLMWIEIDPKKKDQPEKDQHLQISNNCKEREV